MSKARQLADLGNQVDDGAITGTNMVINGGMTISQRGTNFVSPASGDYLLDRVLYQYNLTAARITATQESDGVVGVSPKSLKAQITTAASSSPSAGDFTQFLYHFEGNDVDHLGLGTSSCKPITLSFYIKCSTTGTLPIGVSNGGTRSFAATYNVTEANVWQRHVIKIQPVTDGSWPSGINKGLELRLGLEYGSDYTGCAVNQWNSTTNFSNFTTTYTNPVASTLNATWQITGVCLNVGDSAIDFPHDESYGETLAKCQRYFEKLDDPMFRGVETSTQTARRMGCHFKVEKRSTPSVTLSGTLRVYNGTGTASVVQSQLQNGWANNSSFNFDSDLGSMSGSSAGNACVSYTQTSGVVECSLLIDAEL